MKLKSDEKFVLPDDGSLILITEINFDYGSLQNRIIPMKGVRFEINYDDKEIAGVKANMIIVEYPDDTPDEVIEKDFTDWVFNQLDTAIIDP